MSGSDAEASKDVCKQCGHGSKQHAPMEPEYTFKCDVCQCEKYLQ